MTSLLLKQSPPSAPGRRQAPPPPPLEPLERLPVVEEPEGTEKRRLQGAQQGTSAFIWLPTVGMPTE